MSAAQAFEGEHALLAAISAGRSELSEAANCREWSLSDAEVVHGLGELLALRAQVEAATARLVAQAETRCLGAQLDSSTTERWLRRRFRVSAREAGRLTGLASTLTRYERVQAALSTGAVNAEQAGSMARALESLPGTATEADRERAQGLLVEQAATLDPEELARCGRVLAEVLTTTPDTDDPAEAERLAAQAERLADFQDQQQELWLRTRRDGMVRMGGLFTPLAGAAVRASLTQLAERLPGPDGAADLRGPGQRMAGALHELALTALPSGQLPSRLGATPDAMDAGAEWLPGLGSTGESIEDYGDGDGDGRKPARPPVGPAESGGLPRVTPPQVSLIVRWESLQALSTKAGQLEDGAVLAPSELLAALCDADLLPMVFAGPARPLHAGRRRRLFTRTQRGALTARDRGCAYPGCTRPAPRTTAHHLVHWAHGGPTDVDNGCLLCPYHHTRIHREKWQGRLAPNGYPEFVPPPSYDPQRRPRQNLRYSTAA